MWTNENRGRYDRSGLRYPSDLTNEEWALVEQFIAPARRGGAKRTVDVREVVKERARSLGVDNQSALLEAAKAPTPHKQIETLERRAEHPSRAVWAP